MKKHWILLAILTLSLVCGSAFARDRGGRRPSPPPQRPPAKDCFDEAGISQDQIDAMNVIRLAAIEALREAETPKKARDIIEDMREAMKLVLTPEQLAALEECRQRNRPRNGNCMDQLDLTPAQIDEMDVIRQAAMDAIREAEGPVNASDIFEQMQQLIEDVMTPDQLEAYRDCIRPRLRLNCMDTIGLTEEQIAAMDGLREVAIAELQEAQGRDEVRQIMDQLHEDIMFLLTDDQLAALEECRDGQRHGRRSPPEPEPDE